MTEIKINNDGCLRISGDEIILKDAVGNAFDLGGRDAVSLCRCGLSQNKPFCDGAHREGGFSSTVVACALAPK